MINEFSCCGGLLNEINNCKECATYQLFLSLFLFLCFIRLVSTNWRSALLHALGGCKAMIIRVRFAMLYTTGGKSKKPWWWCSVKVRVGSIPLYTKSLAPADFGGTVFTCVHFQKVDQISSLFDFHYITEGILSLMRFWLLMT